MKRIILLSIPFFLLLSACNNLAEENSNDTETKSKTTKSDDITNQINNEFFGLWTNTEGEIYEVFMSGNSDSKEIYKDQKCPKQIGFSPNPENDAVKKISKSYDEFSDEEINEGLQDNFDNELTISVVSENKLTEPPNYIEGEAIWEINDSNELLMTNPDTAGEKESYCLYEKTTEFQ